MPGTTQASSRNSQYPSYGRSGWSGRPIAGASYPPGAVLQLVSQDNQVFGDEATIQPVPASASQQKLCGVVREDWAGFSANITPGVFQAPSNIQAVRGTMYVPYIVEGYHPGVLVDQSGAGAVTLTDGLQLVSSRNSVGYAQGLAATTAGGHSGVIGNAALPAAGIGSSIPAAALAQASQTATITAPAAGDSPTFTIQTPYVGTAPGVAQTTTWTVPPLTTAQAANATAAAAACVAYLNAQPGFALFFTASNVAGVITITVNALSTPFNVNFGPGIDGQAEASNFQISLSGAVGNSLSFATGVVGTGGTGNAAGGANLAGGTGFKGLLPAWICSVM